MTQSIFIFGPSCSGKSTLGKALQKSLGPSWTYIDRDHLIENEGCAEADADTALEKRVQEIGQRVIVDAQIPWREKKQDEIYCLLLPPLPALLERDAQRTKILMRPEKRARWARQYVIDTHETLSKADKSSFSLCIDSYIPLSAEIAAVGKILSTTS